MRLLKLPWLNHTVESRHVECYSVAVNKSGTRLASGGLDGNVKIWDTTSIVAFTSEGPMDPMQEPIRRPLCSMSRHNGVVTSVKFSPDGRFLATGSDDKICLIWERDDTQTTRPKMFGEAEADLEHWTVRKRLVAHDNDIQDICWLCDGMLLVTVGLDRLIIIWNGLTFERIKRYDIHQSMVKGIVFDPANKFFATASDDRSVRIFRYHKKNEYLSYEFQVEQVILEPFKKSPLTSYFRRMSWSPDGQHIAVPNATNGPVSSVVVINRGNWSTEISLIGHEAPCEVCSFNPCLFTQDSRSLEPIYSAVLATAGQDRSLAIWRTGNMRPILVAHAISSNLITDLCWLPKGDVLYISSLDGLISCLVFETGELGTLVNMSIVDTQLHKFGAERESAMFPESVSQLDLEDFAKQPSAHTRTIAAARKPLVLATDTYPEPVLSFVGTAKPLLLGTPHRQPSKMVQSVTIKNGKRRVAPMLVSSAAKPVISLKPQVEKVALTPSSRVSRAVHCIPRFGIQTAVRGIKLRTLDGKHGDQTLGTEIDNDNLDMGISEMGNPGASFSGTEFFSRRQRNKLRRLSIEARYPNCFKLVTNLPEELFNNFAVVNQEVNSLYNSITNSCSDTQAEISSSAAIDINQDVLFLVIVRWVRHKVQSEPFQANETNQHDISHTVHNDRDTQHGGILKVDTMGSNTIDDNCCKVTRDDLDVNMAETISLRDQTTEETITTTIEVRNGQTWPRYEDEDLADNPIDFNDPTKVMVSNSRQYSVREFTLYFAYRIQHVHPVLHENGVLSSIALVSFHGTIQLVSAATGKYICPAFEMGANVVKVTLKNGILCILTSTGLVFVWKILLLTLHLQCVINGISILPVANLLPINSSPGTTSNAKLISTIVPRISFFEIGLEGTPYLIMQGSANVYCYSTKLGCWTRILEAWHLLSMTEPVPDLGEASWMQTAKKQHWKDAKQGLINTYNLDKTDRKLISIMRDRYHETDALTLHVISS